MTDCKTSSHLSIQSCLARLYDAVFIHNSIGKKGILTIYCSNGVEIIPFEFKFLSCDEC